jgi:hypothetical protein
MAKSLKEKFEALIDQRSAEWLDLQIVRLGKDSTQLIDTGKPGLLWARLENGKPIKVHVGSANVPSHFDLHLLVGRRKAQPKIWYVLVMLEDYDAPAGGGELTYHHKQHEEGGGDRLDLSWKQIVARSVRVKNAAGFIVRVFGDPDLTPNGWVLIPTQDRDLSSYVPTTGALFVAIESDDDGALSENAGTPFAAPGAGTAADYPVPAAGSYTRALVLLFEGQTALLDEHIRIPKPPSFNPASIGSHVHALDDLSDVNAPSPTDGQVLTYDFYAEEWIAADPTGGSGAGVSSISKAGETELTGDVTLSEGTNITLTQVGNDIEISSTGGGVTLQLVMEPGVTHPPVPVETPDGDDWVYYEV